MSVTPMSTATPLPRLTFDGAARLKVALLVIAFVAAFWGMLDFIPPQLGSVAYHWFYDPDWSHGPLIPVFSAYLVYTRWDRVQRCPVRRAWWGLPVMGVGLLLHLWQLSGTLLFAYAAPAAMMITLLGVILLLCGTTVLRYVWLPWLYLFFAIPLPVRVYFALTQPLRELAAKVAELVLNLVPKLEVQRVGSTLEYVYAGTAGQLEVADACSGMRSTVTLCALGVAVAFMSDRPRWQQIVLVLSCVPIATLCNFVRVTITSLLHVFAPPQYSQGQWHMALGLAMILLAFGIFTALGGLLSRLFVEEDAEEEPPAAHLRAVPRASSGDGDRAR